MNEDLRLLLTCRLSLVRNRLRLFNKAKVKVVFHSTVAAL